MGTIPPQEILKQWQLEQMTVEMAVGHILQNLVEFHESMAQLTRSLYKMRADVDRLIAYTQMHADPTDKRKPSERD